MEIEDEGGVDLSGKRLGEEGDTVDGFLLFFLLLLVLLLLLLRKKIKAIRVLVMVFIGTTLEKLF